MADTTSHASQRRYPPEIKERAVRLVRETLKKHHAGGGQVRMAVAVRGRVTVGGTIRQADFRDRATGVLAESAALLSLPEGQVAINPRGAVGFPSAVD